VVGADRRGVEKRANNLPSIPGILADRLCGRTPGLAPTRGALGSRGCRAVTGPVPTASS
jgi:hypothetical protein